jgi:hypothetical protein
LTSSDKTLESFAVEARPMPADGRPNAIARCQAIESASLERA